MPKGAPLIRSSVALRGIATGMTFLSLAGMSAFASTHVQNAAAPLKPTVASTNEQTAAMTSTVARATATPAPTSRTTRITGRVATTTQTARTRTASS